MQLNKIRIIFLALLFILRSSVTSFGAVLPQQDTAVFVSQFAEDNEKCLKCHGQSKYSYPNETLGTQVPALMCADRVINRGDFYSSNHKSFACVDCHDNAYETFPHPGELRMAQKFNCIDCHGGDESFAQYHFEEIEVQYQKSVHFKLESEGFSCWKCHDPHSYKVNIRNDGNLKQTIAYDNAICLNCHSDFNRYQLLTEKEEINIIEKHDWLPNQALHFSGVRCIECHTRVSDTVLVSHMIMPKTEAVKRCNECHSQNSLLMASLYKFKSKEQRKDGFFNGIILNESYVIGANRNEYLNKLSLIIFAAVMAVIIVHVYLRSRKKHQDY
ncbi:MAG TPA: cytochrome c3 family protein [Bacteroidales bacterium]|nr:cytochrome c3 family protein [Bacteroidales bacterium]